MSDAELDTMDRDARRFMSPDVPSITLARHIERLVAEVRRLRKLRDADILRGCVHANYCEAEAAQSRADAALQYDGFVDPPARHSPPGAAST